MIAVKRCESCGEMGGYFTSQSNPSNATFAYCRCQPEGWEICGRHEGNVRRRHRSVRVLNEQGEYRYFSVYAMMAPCRIDTCFTPETQFFTEVQRVNSMGAQMIR